MTPDPHQKEGAFFNPPHNCTLYVFDAIKKGLNPAKMVKAGIYSKRSIMASLRVLRASRHIRKVGYGVWEIIKEGAVIQIGHSKKGAVRSHGFGFYLRIPKIKNWENRQVFLQRQGIAFKQGSLVNVQSQTFTFKSFHVTLFNRGIQFVALKGSDSFFSNSAVYGREQAVFKVKEVIKGLESVFGVGFLIERRHCLKVTRQHHALVKNELAKMYADKKLKVFSEKGLWLLIDFSEGVHELETVHGASADSDMDNAVKPFFNDLKSHFEKTGEPLKMSDLLKNQILYFENITLHLEVERETLKTLKKIQEHFDKS